MRMITTEQKHDPEFWDGNINDAVPEVFFVNEQLGTNFIVPEATEIEMILANNSGDFEKKNAIRLQVLKGFGLTDEQIADITKKWNQRNRKHNFMYYAVGLADRTDFTVKMSNPNPDEPTSPFPKSGFNKTVLTVRGGTETLGLWDVLKIGLFQLGILGNASMLKMIDKVAKGGKFIGYSARCSLLEVSIGFHPGGNCSFTFRPNQLRKKK